MTTKLLYSKTAQKSLILFAFFIFNLSAFSQNEFVTTWKTDNPGTSNSTSITIPTTGVGYNYSVDWTYDGVTFNAESTGVTGDITHDYGAPGTYKVAISGTFPRIYFLSSGDNQKIVSIEQWGTNPWTTMYGAFYNCSNLVYNASVAPDLSGVTETGLMFAGATSFNGDLSTWDVSNVIYMGGMFNGCSSFNGDVSTWNVGNVTSMQGIFSNATIFNGDVSSWDVSSVIDMSFMFDGTAFNGDLSGWNVSNVIDMGNMFANATVFNGDISFWNVSNVTNMSGMFTFTANFNGNLFGWDVSKVTDMSYMFRNATAFSGGFLLWDVSSVTNMKFMFTNATAFFGDISSWDVGSVTDMSYMFAVTTFNADLSNWNVGNVTNMAYMFATSTFNGDLSSWNVGNVTDMSSMFANSTAFSGDLSTWDVSNVTNMFGMFQNSSTFDSDLSGWNVGNVTDMGFMFYNATGFDRDLGTWDISSVTSMGVMFIGATLSTINYDNTLIGWNTLTGGETKIPTGITFHGGNSNYCNGETARLSLINDKNWNITDDGKDCSGLGVEDNLLYSLMLIPNPARNEFRIDGLSENSFLEIYDLNGLLVQKQAQYLGTSIDVSSLSSSVYFVKISNRNGTSLKRLLKL